MEGAAEVVTLQRELQLVEQGRHVLGAQLRVDAQDRLFEVLREDVAARVTSAVLERKVAVAKPGEMQQRRDLDPRILVEDGHPGAPDSASCPPMDTCGVECARCAGSGQTACAGLPCRARMCRQINTIPSQPSP